MATSARCNLLRISTPTERHGDRARNGEPARLYTLVAYGVVLLAAALRLFHLGSQSYWYDEAYTTHLSRLDLGTMVGQAALDTSPPLYYLLLHLWLGLGTSEFLSRFLSYLFGVLAVALVYTVGRKILDPRVALTASTWAAISPFQVFYSQEVRMYSLVAMLSLLAVRLFIAAMTSVRSREWIAFGLVGAGLLYTHNLAPTVLLVPIAYSLLKRELIAKIWKGMVGAYVLMGLLFAPWLAFLPAQIVHVGRSFWAPPPDWASPLLSLHAFLFGASLPLQVVPVALILLLLTLALTSTAAFRQRQQGVRIVAGTSPEAFSIVALWLIVPIAVVYAASQYRPVYLDRVLVAASFPVYLALAWGIFNIRPKLVAVVVSVSVGGLMLVSLFNWYFNPSVGKPPLRPAADYIASQLRAGDGIAHTSDGSYLPFALYLPGADQRLLAGDPEYLAGTSRAWSTEQVLGFRAQPMSQAVVGKQRVWLVVALDHSADWQKTQKAIFDQQYRLVEERDFGGVGIFLYQLLPATPEHGRNGTGDGLGSPE